MNGTAGGLGKHRGHKETIAVKKKCHFKLSQKFNVLLPVLLGKELALVKK